MKIIDISWPNSPQMTAYKDKKVVEFRNVKTFEKDQGRETIIKLSSHTGTHVDAPSHFTKDGISIEKINLNQIIGSAKVVDLTSVENNISKTDLKHCDIQPGDIVLLKTKNSQRSATESFNYDFIYLHASGAHFLIEKKIKAVGIDYLGIERNQPNHETHTTLMNNNIVIIEGLRLAPVKAGTYFLCCLPLCNVNLEAAPARAVLIEGI